MVEERRPSAARSTTLSRDGKRGEGLLPRERCSEEDSLFRTQRSKEKREIDGGIEEEEGAVDDDDDAGADDDDGVARDNDDRDTLLVVAVTVFIATSPPSLFSQSPSSSSPL
jgi:hypothetical protein